MVRAQEHSITVRKIDRVVRKPPAFDLARSPRNQFGDVTCGSQVREAFHELLGCFQTQLVFCFRLALAKRADRFR